MLDIDLKKVLADFGDALGIELAFDAQGACVLTVGDETPVAIQANVEDSSLTLSSAVRDAMSENMSLDQAQNLLALALDPYDRGAASPVVGYDAESGLVVLYEVLAPSVLRRTPLSEAFTDFMTTRKAVVALLDEQVEAPMALNDAITRLWV